MTNENTTLITAEKFESTFTDSPDLPVMPEVGSQLIALKGKEDVEIADLVPLIEADPVISAKVVAYASSPFFSYQGKLDSIKEAVYHVLGLDMSMNIALSLAVGNQFQGPIKGPVGAFSVWSHSIYCAVLSQAIASKIKNQQDLKVGTAYLYGLLHNVGYLALGHMFSDEFTTFNKTVQSETDAPLSELERNVLGATHTKAGSLLMSSWEMPEEYGVIMQNHHNSEYTGPHQVYTHISYIANALLKSADIGDASDVVLPQHLLEEYNLKESDLQEKLKVVLQWQENIDHLANQLAA